MADSGTKTSSPERKRSASDDRSEISWFAWKRDFAVTQPFNLNASPAPAQRS